MLNQEFSWRELPQGTKWTDLEKRSTTVRMVELQFEGGRPVTKPTAMWEQGRLGTGRGTMRILTSGTEHTAMNSLTSLNRLGHQKCWQRSWHVRWNLEWKVSLEMWPHMRTPETGILGLKEAVCWGFFRRSFTACCWAPFWKGKLWHCADDA